MIMKDVTGKTLLIGDKVVATFDGYADLEVALVTSFTPKKIGLIRRSNGGYYTKFPIQVSLVEKVS